MYDTRQSATTLQLHKYIEEQKLAPQEQQNMYIAQLLPAIILLNLMLAGLLSLNVFAQNLAPTPADYPTESVSDSYTSAPFSPDYEKRRRTFLEFQAANPGNGPYSEAARMSLGLMPDEGRIKGALDKMDARGDCADFGMHGILRLLYQFGENPLLSNGFRALARRSLLNFRYWPDEPGVDSMCTWSENHHILFSAGGYLAGQLYPDEIFTNSGQTGREKMEIMRPRVIRWLDLRYKTGFSEWLSNVYYDEDIAPVVNLIDFCQDEEIAKKATMVLDLILTDMALNHFRGTFGSTHGRSYEGNKINGAREGTSAVYKLMFGLNTFKVGNMSATSLTLSEKYSMPQVIYEIATDMDREEIVNRQRMGIRLEEAARWGLDFDRLEDGMTFLSLEAYSHPKTIKLMVRMLDEYNWWENDFFLPFKDQKKLLKIAQKMRLLPLIARIFERDLTRNMRTEINIYTYRTPDYMLSSAQDYRKGYGGDQQHIWSATLGTEAICFTTHPAKLGGDSPNYWTGSGNLPRVAQVKNVAIILYEISTRMGLYVTHKLEYTHAWLPGDKFDEVVERDGWIFARKDDAYLALWSEQPYRWQTEGEYRYTEIIADGKKNIWICELGRKAVDGDFADFMKRILEASLETDGLKIAYRSPSQGLLEFGWDRPLKQDGETVRIGKYPRYGNLYAEAPFPGDRISLGHNGHWLKLNYQTLTREVSDFVGRQRE
jgi:hypothetical protein